MKGALAVSAALFTLSLATTLSYEAPLAGVDANGDRIEGWSLAAEGVRIYVAARVDGASGSGAEVDPAAAGTNAEFQAVLDAAPSGATIEMLDGTYPNMNLRVSKSLTLRGSRKAILTQAAGVEKPIFWLSGSATDFRLEGVSLIHGSGFREEVNVAAIFGEPRTVRLQNIHSRDFNNTLRVGENGATEEVWVEGSEFDYTYGRAGISNVEGGNSYHHPCASIVGHPKRLIVINNRANGLVDKTFAGVSPEAPASQRNPADNFVQTGNHNHCQVEGNVIENFGVECIFIYRASSAGNYFCRIANNEISGAPYKSFSGVGGAYNPGIKLHDVRGEVVNNRIRDISLGISITFTASSEDNVARIHGNEILYCLTGIEALGGSTELSIDGNFIRNSSEPARTAFSGAFGTSDLFGVRADRGSVTKNKLLSDEPVYDATTALVSRSGNVFTLSSVSGITSNVGWLVSYSGETVSAFPVQGIAGNDVTVDPGWAGSQPAVDSGPIHYQEESFGPQYPAGIAVVNGGTIEASSNIVIGHRTDVSQQNSGKIVMTDHTTRGCHKNQAAETGKFEHKGSLSVVSERVSDEHRQEVSPGK